jgi:ribonuclease P protein component
LSVSPAFFSRILRERGDFESVLKFDCRVTGRNFLVRGKPNARSYARLGIIAGKKVAARAVDRNRGKRLIREWFRAVAAEIGPLDVVVQLRSDLRQQTNDAARRELHGLLQGLDKCRAR